MLTQQPRSPGPISTGRPPTHARSRLAVIPRILTERPWTHSGSCLAVILVLLAVLTPPRAWGAPACSIPNDLALRDIALPEAKREVAVDKQLIVLTFGGVAPAGANAETLGATYPARLEAALKAALPGVEVEVKNEPPPGRTSADVPAMLADLIAQTGARLVIWGPGGRDVEAHLDLDLFSAAVTRGIEAVRDAGADLILLDTTFVPSPARMARIEAYRQELLSAAEAKHVPVLRRHALMRAWSEDGSLNLGARDPGEREQVTRMLFSCVAQGLATPIAAAVR
jgi:acyl-CoA thioesterase-1